MNINENSKTVQIPIEEVRQYDNQLEFLEERIAELEFQKEYAGWTHLGGESSYEFTVSYLQRIVARARLFFLHNPLINRAVTLQSDYVFAQGMNIVATDKKINPVIQAFIDNKGNQRELTGHQAKLLKEQTLMIDGNIFFVLFTARDDDGMVQVRTILVDEITDIITNPDDANEVWYYKREWTARNPITGAITNNKRYYPDINYTPLNTPAKINHIDIDWMAPIYHVKVGALTKSRYGVPEVYSALDWAKAHQNFLEDWITIVRMYARWAFNLKVPGGAAAVAGAKRKLGTTISTQGSALERNPAPTTGAIFTSSKEAAELSVIRTSGATTSAQDGREIRMMVAAALGIPDTFFGDVDVGNLATARTLDRPTELKYRSRQQLWTEVYTEILNYVVTWAIRAPNGPLKSYAKTQLNRQGRIEIDGREEFDTHIEVTFPPILEHSIQDRIDAVTKAVTLDGKTLAVNSPEFAILSVRLMLQALGITDVDEVLKDIFVNATFPDPKVQSNNTPEPNNSDGNGNGNGNQIPASTDEP